MLKRYLTALLLSSFLFGCNGSGDGGDQSAKPETDDVSRQSHDQQQDQQRDSRSSSQDDSGLLSFNEIQEGIKSVHEEIEKLGFTFLVNDQKVGLKVLTSSRFSSQGYFFRSMGKDIPVKTSSFDLVSGEEYCRFKGVGVSVQGNHLISDKEKKKCHREVSKRHKSLIRQLSNIEHLETELLERFSSELSQNEEIIHLAKLKLSIQIKELTKRYDKYLQEKQKFLYTEWGKVGELLTDEEFQNVIVIRDVKKTPYHIHLLASDNSPKLGEMAEEGKITLLDDLNQRFPYDQRVVVYKTSLFTYVQLIDSKS